MWTGAPMTEAQKEYIITENELKKIIEVLNDEGCKGMASVCEKRIRSRQYIHDAILDDFVYWMINKSDVVGYAHILDAIKKYKTYREMVRP